MRECRPLRGSSFYVSSPTTAVGYILSRLRCSAISALEGGEVFIEVRDGLDAAVVVF